MANELSKWRVFDRLVASGEMMEKIVKIQLVCLIMSQSFLNAKYVSYFMTSSLTFNTVFQSVMGCTLIYVTERRCRLVIVCQ